MAKRDYTDEEIETGLTYLVMAAGNTRAAADRLKADGKVVIPRTTLRDWRVDKADRYAEILALKEQSRRESTAERLDALSQREIAAMDKTLDVYETALKKGEIVGKDITNSLRNLALSLGIKTDKANVLRDRPTGTVAHRWDVQQLDTMMQRLLEGVEENITDAEEVREPAELSRGTE